MLRITRNYYKIPAVVRSQVWLSHAGTRGQILCKCCERSMITPFDFHCAHIVPEAKGGNILLSNLVPSCKSCNQSMGTMNFYVFKSKLLSQAVYDMNKMSDSQKQVVNYYKHMSENMTINTYHKNFNRWFDIISKTMEVNVAKINKDEHQCFYKNTVKCNCGYEFVYITFNNDFSLTCKDNKQNIIDVICDHIPCIIRDIEFVESSIQLQLDHCKNKSA